MTTGPPGSSFVNRARSAPRGSTAMGSSFSSWATRGQKLKGGASLSHTGWSVRLSGCARCRMSGRQPGEASRSSPTCSQRRRASARTRQCSCRSVWLAHSSQARGGRGRRAPVSARTLGGPATTSPTTASSPALARAVIRPVNAAGTDHPDGEPSPAGRKQAVPWEAGGRGRGEPGRRPFHRCGRRGPWRPFGRPSSVRRLPAGPAPPKAARPRALAAAPARRSSWSGPDPRERRASPGRRRRPATPWGVPPGRRSDRHVRGDRPAPRDGPAGRAGTRRRPRTRTSPLRPESNEA